MSGVKPQARTSQLFARYQYSHHRTLIIYNGNDTIQGGAAPHQNSPEPEAAAGGAGALSGGGRTGRKINQDRAVIAADQVSQLRSTLAQLRSYSKQDTRDQRRDQKSSRPN
jgi:hypothetical protein